MQLAQEVRGDLPMNHIVWDAETGSLDTLAASVLLFIKREQTPPPKMDRSPASSPMMKRKYYASDESSDLASDEVPNSPLAGDVSKRMKRSPSEDDFASDEWVHSNESRKISRFSRSHSQEFDSDFEYEHAGEEEEEDYAFEEDDDEWSDGRLLNPTSPTSPSMSRTPRKKAPSGTACEKHKRWKKRCPEDCPMRKTKSKRSKAPSPLVRSRSRQDLSSRDDHLSLLQWSIDQFSQESDSAIESHNSDSSTGQMDSEPEMIMNHPKMRNKTHLIRSQSTDELDLESPKVKAPKKIAAPKRNRGTRKYLPQACDRHKLLHAKCPANCPDRMKRDAELAQQLDY